MPRKPNTHQPVKITVSISPLLCSDLDKVVQTGYFGNTRAETAERLITEAIRNLLKEGTLIRKTTPIEM